MLSLHSRAWRPVEKVEPRALARVLAAGALLLGFAHGAVAAAGAPQGQTPSRAARVAVGDEAPDFALRSLDGTSYRLADLRGEKTAIVIFFRGTW